MSLVAAYLHSTNASYYETDRKSLATFFKSEADAVRAVVRDGMRIADIGCNRAGLLSAISEITTKVQYTGVDVDPVALSLARQNHPTQTFLQGEFPKVPGLETNFDAVFCYALFQHFTDWKSALRELARLTPAGKVVLDVTMTLGRTINDGDVSYSYYFGSGKRVPIVIINAFEFINYCFTEHVGAGHVALNLRHAHTAGGMWAVAAGEGLRGTAVITKDVTGKPIFGGATLQNNPDFIASAGVDRFRFPSVDVTIDGEKMSNHPFAAN